MRSTGARNGASGTRLTSAMIRRAPRYASDETNGGRGTGQWRTGKRSTRTPFRISSAGRVYCAGAGVPEVL